jgi:hypothetical protein
MPGVASELIKHEGLYSQAFIGHLSRALATRNYLEVGTSTGDSLAAVDCPAMAIDPKFMINRNVIGAKPACHFFQTTSDAFFAACDPKAYFGGTVDLAFLDGLHLFEYLLRDFINVERHCDPESIILLHDCLPPTYEMACRNIKGTEGNEFGARGHPDYLGYWTGDVWKVAEILREFRPELRVLYVNSPPTGLVLCTSLDPTSTVLKDRYEEITGTYSRDEFNQTRLEQFYSSIQLTSTDALTSRADLITRLDEASSRRLPTPS